MSTIPNDPKERQAIRTALDQISEQMSDIQTAKVQINEILKALEDKYKIPKKTLRKVANLYFKQTVTEFETEASEIKEVYKSIVS